MPREPIAIPPTRAQRCETCAAFSESAPGQAECRAQYPILIPTNVGPGSAWPPTRKDNWCLQWKANETN